jgi:hypothetical protein
VCNSDGGQVEAEALSTLESLPLSKSIRTFLIKHLGEEKPSPHEHWMQVFGWNERDQDFSKTVYFVMGVVDILVKTKGNEEE